MPPGPSNRGAEAAHPDHRPEPAGALRPAGLARVPGPDLGGLPGGRGLPEGPAETRPTRSSTGCELYKYRPYAPGGSKLSFIAEYVYSFLATAWLTLKARRSRPVRGHPGLQPAGHLLADRAGLPRARAAPSSSSTTTTCARSCSNPASRAARELPYRGLRALERRTHRAADHVISTNDSYREIAMNRSGKAADDVTVVRTGPDPRRAQARARGPGAAPRPHVPGRLHRRHGPAGRRGHRGPGGRHRGPRARPRRHRASR